MSDRDFTTENSSLVQPPTLNIRLPVFLALGLAGLIAISLAITWTFYTTWSGPRTLEKQAAREHVPAEDRRMSAAPLSANQRQEHLAYEAQQHEVLTTYGWIDRRAGIARIPIEQAMQRLAEQGDQP